MNTHSLLILLLLTSTTFYAAHTPPLNTQAPVDKQREKITNQLNDVLTHQQRASAQRTTQAEKKLAQDKKMFEKNAAQKEAEIKRLQLERLQSELEHAKQKLAQLENDREALVQDIKARKTELTHQANAVRTASQDNEYPLSVADISPSDNDIDEHTPPSDPAVIGISTGWQELNKKSVLTAGGGCIACALIGIKMYNIYANQTNNKEEKDAQINHAAAQA